MGTNQPGSKTRIRDGSQYLIVERKTVDHRTRPMIHEATIRDGVPADHAGAREIQMAAFGDVHWPFGDEPLKVAEIAGGEMLGYLVWRRTFDDEFEILSLATHPKHRRKGVARALIHDFCARHKGDVFLEVRESNLGAIAFYESIGFERTGVRHAYYGNNSEGAIVMKLRF
ncbi:MAG TPA: GNAT family N-acetyltransferase [Bryobacteraceae bacterium]|jgi:ribosomal-protein-alanine N-acetyltransferase